MCGDGDEANGKSRGEGHLRGVLRDYKFRDEGGSEEAKGGTLNSRVSALHGRIKFD